MLSTKYHTLCRFSFNLMYVLLFFNWKVNHTVTERVDVLYYQSCIHLSISLFLYISIYLSISLSLYLFMLKYTYIVMLSVAYLLVLYWFLYNSRVYRITVSLLISLNCYLNILINLKFESSPFSEDNSPQELLAFQDGLFTLYVHHRSMLPTRYKLV